MSYHQVRGAPLNHQPQLRRLYNHRLRVWLHFTTEQHMQSRAWAWRGTITHAKQLQAQLGPDWQLRRMDDDVIKQYGD